MEKEIKLKTHRFPENIKYRISDQGELTSCRSNVTKVITGTLASGYRRANLMTTEGPRRFYIHKLVAETFHPNEDSLKKKVIHLDHNKSNNKPSNLRWVTNKQAIAHQIKQYPNLPQSAKKNIT